MSKPHSRPLNPMLYGSTIAGLRAAIDGDFKYEARELLDSLEEQLETARATIEQREIGYRGALEQLEAVRASASGLETSLEQSLDREASLEEQLKASRVAGHECREHYMRLEEELETLRRGLCGTCAVRLGIYDEPSPAMRRDG